MLRSMITIKKDKKGSTWILTTEDSESFHKQVNLTYQDIIELQGLLKNIIEK